MTTKRIDEQINTIREATKRAAASPETALEFLHRAGIVSIAKKSEIRCLILSPATFSVTMVATVKLAFALSMELMT